MLKKFLKQYFKLHFPKRRVYKKIIITLLIYMVVIIPCLIMFIFISCNFNESNTTNNDFIHVVYHTITYEDPKTRLLFIMTGKRLVWLCVIGVIIGLSIAQAFIFIVVDQKITYYGLTGGLAAGWFNGLNACLDSRGALNYFNGTLIKTKWFHGDSTFNLPDCFIWICTAVWIVGLLVELPWRVVDLYKNRQDWYFGNGKIAPRLLKIE